MIVHEIEFDNVVREAIALKDCVADLRAKLAAANAKWTLYEQEYILPTFVWAERLGFDLRKLVSENAGKNCVVLFVETLEAKLAAAEERERRYVAALQSAKRFLENLRVPQDVLQSAFQIRDGQSIMDKLEVALAATEATP